MKNQLYRLSNLKIALLIFFLAILVVILFWIILPGGFQDVEPSDFLTHYKPLAISLIQGKGYVLNQEWSTRYPPGFSIIIAGFLTLSNLSHLNPIISLAFMILLFSAGSSVVMYLLGEIIWSKSGGIICSLLWMTYPFHLWLTKQPNSEPPFIFFFLLSLLLILLVTNRKHSMFLLFLAGFSIGIAMLIRPIAIGLGLIFAITYWLVSHESKKPQLFGIFLILIGNMLAIFPWEYSTYQNNGEIIPLSSNGVGSIRLGFTFPVKLDDFRKAVDVPVDVKNLAQQILTDSQSISSTKEQFEILSYYLIKEPIPFLKLIIIKLSRTWYGSDTNTYDQYSLTIQVFYLVLIGLSAYISARNKNNKYFLFKISVPSLIYFWVMTIVGMPLLRYMVPVISLTFLFVPAFIQIIFPRCSIIEAENDRNI